MADRTRFTYRADCGCTLSGQLNAAGELSYCGGILRCPLHEAAGDLRQVVERLLHWFPDLDEILGGQMTGEAKYLISAARAALALARTPTKGR